MFHIYPTDGKVNGMRSNNPYGETSSGTTWGTGRLGSSTLASSYTYNGNTYTTTSYSGTVFEPADDYKGDLARSYFYMIAFWGKYKGTSFAQGTYGAVHFNTSYTSAGGYGLTAYSIGLLMKWHRQDPVSQKEIDRNNALQNLSGQGNRNPFIDYPCLAEYFWGDQKDQTFNLSDVVGSFESGFTVGSSSGCSGGGGSTTNYTITWKVNGSQWASTTSSGSSVGTFPTTPTSSNCDGSKVFVGWSKTKITTATNTVPSDLFTATSGTLPTITGATTFYAVFATASSSGSTTKTYTFNITPSDFNTTSYAANNNEKTSTATATDYSTMSVAWTSYQVMQNSSNMQWKKNEAYIYNSTDLGTITAVTITSSAGTFTTYYGTSAQPTSGTTVGNGYFNIKVGSATGTTSNIAVTFNKSTSSTTYSGYITECTSSSCTTNPTVGAGSTTGGSVTTSSAGVACSAGITSLGSTGCSITSYGFVYSTSGNPTIATGTVVQVGTSYTSTGVSFSTTISGLSASTTYYVRPYATNGNGTAYGSQTSFTTPAPVTYTVTWKVNGSTTTTSSVVSGNQVSTLPTEPSAPTACSDKEFVGWSATNIGSTAVNTAPIDLFKTASASPEITSATTFYAVFADAGSGTSNSTKTEDFEAQTAGTTYNSTQEYTTANSNAGLAWTIYYGTVSTNNKITGTNSAQMRWYSSATSNYGYAQTTTAIQGLQSITFNAKATNTNLKMSVWYSTNQSTWTALATNVTMTTSSNSYSYNVNGSSSTNYYIKIGVGNGGTAPTSGNYGLVIDDVVFTYSSTGTTYSNYVTTCAATTYTITWDAATNGGSCGTASTEVTAGSAISTAISSLPTATKTGYTFNGWYTTASSGGSQITTSTVPTGNVTYYARFTINSHTLTVNTNNSSYGTVSGGGTYNYGTSHTITATPTGDCYRFVQWNDGNTNASRSITMPDENVTYTATFEQITYRVTATSDDNTQGTVSVATP